MGIKYIITMIIKVHEIIFEFMHMYDHNSFDFQWNKFIES